MLKSVSLPDNRIKLALHAIAWIFVIIIPIYLSNGTDGGDQHRRYEFYIHSLSAGVIFYLGYLWLVPRFFLQERKITYALLLSGFILGSYFLTSYVKDTLLFDPLQDKKFMEAINKMTGKDENFRPPMKAFGFYNHVLASLLISGFAIGLGVMEKLKLNEKKQKEMEKEKLNSELAFLKNQISPHFFFNTLNNIYSLIGIDAPTAQESVHKLSKLMRYLLYESEHGETLISHEISFMINYIDLMKLRLSSRVELQIDFPKEIAEFTIPPLLFIPFIENAFKHGISNREHSFISIRMKIDRDKICFIAENSIGSGAHQVDLQYSGIGLENVQKRLGLLFPASHQLKINQDQSTFRVELTIQREKLQV